MTTPPPAVLFLISSAPQPMTTHPPSAVFSLTSSAHQPTPVHQQKRSAAEMQRGPTGITTELLNKLRVRATDQREVVRHLSEAFLSRNERLGCSVTGVKRSHVFKVCVRHISRIVGMDRIGHDRAVCGGLYSNSYT